MLWYLEIWSCEGDLKSKLFSFYKQKPKNEELARIMGELNVQDTGTGGGDDLLDLMDSA